MLNSNIRCIEIIIEDVQIVQALGWIVTLDVLKYSLLVSYLLHMNSWIVTLDVLKWYNNMNGRFYIYGWIVTLDVLK